MLALLLAAVPARAEDVVPIVALERQEIAIERGTGKPSFGFRLTLAYLKDTGWNREDILPAVAQAARILAQCGLGLERVELVLVGAPARYRDFSTPSARELARTLPLPKPTVYFVAGTRQRHAFDAEAIGRGNSRSRPELADTVWVTRGARDLGIVLAHELAHVLMDSGQHSTEPDNLMRDETAPENTRLSQEQCDQLTSRSVANGLLQPAGK